jgi:hypothetical protein
MHIARYRMKPTAKIDVPTRNPFSSHIVLSILCPLQGTANNRTPAPRTSERVKSGLLITLTSNSPTARVETSGCRVCKR